jgi:hypothetical protein
MRWVWFALGLTAASAVAQSLPPSSMTPRETILHQQMHGYLDALIELQVKLQQRDKDWAEYSKSLWADHE